MIAYENDNLVIPERYQNMSLLEIEEEKRKLLQEINSTERIKREPKKNKNNIVFY